MADDTQTAELLEQEVTIEEVGPARKKITIVIPESRIKDKTEELYETLQDEAALPGFRRGRAPRRLLEKRFADTIGSDLKSQLLSESYTQVIEEHEFDVIGNPDVEDAENLELPESGDFTFVVEIEVTPDVDLPDFSELKIDRPSADVEDGAIDEEITRLRERFGTMQTVEDAEIEAEDYAQVDVVILAGKGAKDDAEVIAEHPESYALVHGEEHDFKGHVAGILVKDLGKQLIGKKADDVVSISMDGPSAHENDKIKDQPITLKLTIKQVQRVEPASLETLIQQAGVEDEDELKIRVRSMLEERAQREQESAMHKQASEQLLEKVELELPEKLTQNQAARVVQRQQMELMYRGVEGEELEAQLAEARASSEETAKTQLKTFFVLDKAAKDLDVDVTEGELNGRIAMLAMQQGRRPEKMRQEMQQQGQIEQLYLSLREQKTLAAIIEKATVTDAE